MLFELAIPTLETMINGIIKLDPAAPQRLSTLDNSLYQFTINDLNISFFLRVDDEYLQLKSASEPSEEILNALSAELSGNSSAFFNLALAEKGSDALFTGDVRFNGNIGSAQKLQHFFESLDIDWEEVMARHTGDFVAYQVFKQSRKAHSWFNEQLGISKNNLSEYLKFEARVTPAPIELENFYDDVATLEADVDRLAHKLERLLARRTSETEL